MDPSVLAHAAVKRKENHVGHTANIKNAVTDKGSSGDLCAQIIKARRLLGNGIHKVSVGGEGIFILRAVIRKKNIEKGNAVPASAK